MVRQVNPDPTKCNLQLDGVFVCDEPKQYLGKQGSQKPFCSKHQTTYNTGKTQVRRASRAPAADVVQLDIQVTAAPTPQLGTSGLIEVRTIEPVNDAPLSPPPVKGRLVLRLHNILPPKSQ